MSDPNVPLAVCMFLGLVLVTMLTFRVESLHKRLDRQAAQLDNLLKMSGRIEPQHVHRGNGRTMLD